MEEKAVSVELCIRLRAGALLPLLEALEGATVGRTSAQDRERLQELAGALRAALGSPQPPAVAEPPAAAAPAPAAEPSGIESERLYNAREVARFLGLQRRKSVHDIPAGELVPTWIGPRRGSKRFRGSDVLAYMDRGRRPGLRR